MLNGSFGLRIQSVAAPWLNSRSGRFAIKLPTISDGGNAHDPVGLQVVGERQVMSGRASQQHQPLMASRLLNCPTRL